MEPEKAMPFEIKLPSDTTKVSVQNLWDYSEVIAKTGKVFSIEQLIKQNCPHTHEDPIGRNLSYLKYLGFLIERRERLAGKKEKTQKFYWSENPDVKDFYYLLQSKRKEEARKKWEFLISSSDLAKAVKNGVFKDADRATTFELEDFIRRSTGEKHNALYYQNAAKFVSELLENAGFVAYDRSQNMVFLKNSTPANDDQQKEDPPMKEQPQQEIPVQLLANESDYAISIRGKDVKMDIIVKDEDDLKDAEVVIRMIKRKLQPIKKDAQTME